MAGYEIVARATRKRRRRRRKSDTSCADAYLDYLTKVMLIAVFVRQVHHVNYKSLTEGEAQRAYQMRGRADPTLKSMVEDVLCVGAYKRLGICWVDEALAWDAVLHRFGVFKP